MKKIIASSALCAVLILGAGAAQAETSVSPTTTSTASMLAKIQELMKLIADLQVKLAQVRGEVQELTKDLALGAKDDDVKKVQELLASDPTLFGVKPTGYLGPITVEAIKKFQERYGLPVTGVVDEATREVMKELRKERVHGDVPPGLVKSDEVKARIKARLQAKWGDCVWGPKFRASDCKKGHDGKHDDNDDNASTTKATRAEAQAAITDAEDAIADLKDEIDQMEEDDADQDDIDDANDDLDDAEEKLMKARRAFAKGEYGDAVDHAEDAVEKASGDNSDDSADDDDDDEDDEDDDSKDDDDEDDD